MAGGKGKAVRAARPPRSREVPEVRRKALIEATMRSIAKHGFAGTTIEKICDEAQVSRGLINHHFGSKDELIRQSYKTLCDDWKYTAHDMLDGQREPEDELRAVIRISFGPAMFKPEYLGIWLGFWSVIGKSPPLKKLNRDLCRQDLAVFQTLFERVAAKRGEAIDAWAHATALLAMMDGLWLQWCLDPKSFTVTQAEAACLDYVARIFPGAWEAA
jgi:TetR/AcrR family transcriptional regulator, transcriptional repressor of bet genes